VSQVHYQEIPHDWEYSLDHAPVIVRARRTGPAALYREQVFPRETHVDGTEETVAREFARPYEILEVIRPAAGRPLGPGQEIRVWQEPEYGPTELEHFHRTGSIHSPFILVKEAEEEVREGRLVLFLEPHEGVWRSFNGAPEEGEALLKRRSRGELVPPERLLWHFENRSAFHRDGVAWWISESGLVAVHAVRPAEGAFLEERRGLWRLLPEDWEALSPLISGTDWSRLAFQGTLIPDETRPRIDTPGPDGGSWLVEASGSTPETRAYRRLLGALQGDAEGLRWRTVRESTVDFGWQPEAFR
jgi:hypothetical protein